eukprot:jgi/Tetstr1/442513/TSEL_030611.t1
MASSGLAATRAAAVELLNEAKISGPAERGTALQQVAELVVRKEPALISEFLPSLCELQIDAAAAVRRVVAGVMEDVARATDLPTDFLQCEQCLLALLSDDATAVVKRSISAATAVHRAVLDQLRRGRWPAAALEDCWAKAAAMRERITGLLTSEGVSGPVRTLAVKFVEGAVLSYTDSQRLSCRSPTAEQLCADADKQVWPRSWGLLRPATGLPNQVLLVAMQTAVEVSRQRPQYYATVARAFYELGSSGAYLVGSGAGPEASIAHALKKHLIELIRARAKEAAEFRSQLVEAMSVIGAADDAAEAVRKAEKSARREQRSRAADVEMGAEADAAVAVAPAAAAPPEAAETGAVELHQVRVLLAALLAKGDTATLRGFVDQLPGGVLADVVVASMEHLPAGENAGSSAGLASLLGQLDGAAAAEAAEDAKEAAGEAATPAATQATKPVVKAEVKAEDSAKGEAPPAPAK